LPVVPTHIETMMDPRTPTSAQFGPTEVVRLSVPSQLSKEQVDVRGQQT
jgi:hypothetical protein